LRVNQNDSSAMKIRIGQLFAVFMALVILAGCNPKRSDPNTVEIWAMGAEGEHIQELIPEFQRRNPDIEVSVQVIPWSAAHEKLITAYAGESTPDICQLGNTWIPEFQALNAIIPLDSLVHTSKIINADSYFSGIWQTNLLDSTVYGIPWYVDTRVLFYRKDLLEKAGYPQPPKSWEEWKKASRVLADRELARYAMLIPLNDWRYPIIFGLQNGAGLLRDGSQYGDFSGERFQEAFNYLMGFFRDGLSPLGMTEITNIYQGFADGYYAMIVTGPWNLGEFSRRLPPEMEDKWATAPLPSPDSTYPGLSLAGGSSLVIFRQSKKVEKAWKLIEYLSTVETQSQFYELVGDLPARVESWQDSSLANNSRVHAFYTQLQHVTPTPKVPEWEQIAYKVQQYTESAAYGELEEEQALKNLDSDVDKLLEKRRWLLEESAKDE